ncbi:protein kinase [Thermoproteota archaeon]
MIGKPGLDYRPPLIVQGQKKRLPDGRSCVQVLGSKTQYVSAKKKQGILGSGGFGVAVPVQQRIPKNPVSCLLFGNKAKPMVGKRMVLGPVNGEDGYASGFSPGYEAEQRRVVEREMTAAFNVQGAPNTIAPNLCIEYEGSKNGIPAKKAVMLMTLAEQGELFRFIKRAIEYPNILVEILTRNGITLEDFYCSLLKDTVQALAYYHFKGIAHRDFKPENCLLTDDGRACVSDFGGAGDINNTQEMMEAPGTYVWAAPETVFIRRIQELLQNAQLYRDTLLKGAFEALSRQISVSYFRKGRCDDGDKLTDSIHGLVQESIMGNEVALNELRQLTERVLGYRKSFATQMDNLFYAVNFYLEHRYLNTYVSQILNEHNTEAAFKSIRTSQDMLEIQHIEFDSILTQLLDCLDFYNFKVKLPSAAQDMWSLGSMLYFIFTNGHYPWMAFPMTNPFDQNPVLDGDLWINTTADYCRIMQVFCLTLSESNKADIPKGSWRELAAGLLKTNPAERLTAKQALEHPWLNRPLPPKPVIAEIIKEFNARTIKKN